MLEYFSCINKAIYTKSQISFSSCIMYLIWRLLKKESCGQETALRGEPERVFEMFQSGLNSVQRCS